jgi:hypothetical protein
MLAGAKTDDRSGPAWQAVLQPFPRLEFVVSDAAKGIAAAVAAEQASRPVGVRLGHGLDVFHTAREAQRVLAGPWRRAEAAWDTAVAADERMAEDRRRGRDARGSAARARVAWAEAERCLADVGRQDAAWQRARAAVAVFTADGRLNDRASARAELDAVVAELSGPEWKTVRGFLTDRRTLAFLDRMHERLAAAEPDARVRAACGRRWWLRHRAPAGVPEPRTGREQMEQVLDGVIRDRPLTPDERAAYDRVAAVLRTTVRASSAVEGINSVLRMQQGRHRQMTQGLLDLKRLYWNCRPLPTGRRRGRCPYEWLGVNLPSTDFWTLLRGSSPTNEPKECQNHGL